MTYISRNIIFLHPSHWVYLILTLIGSALGFSAAQAAEPAVKVKDPAYAAQYVAQSLADPITLAPGESKTVKIKFKNTGAAAWNDAGSRFISAYTMEPRDRASAFRGKNWLSAKQTGKLPGTIKPGQAGELVLNLTAPKKTGDYTERFYLAAESHTWVKGGYFFLKISVREKPSIKTPARADGNVEPESGPERAATSTLGYRAHRFILNTKSVAAKGGEQVKIIVGFQNVGATPWQRYAFAPHQGGSALAALGASFADSGWAGRQLVLARDSVVPPGGVLREEFYFRAPREQGVYTASFNLTVDGVEVDGGQLSVPVTVTEDAPDHYQEPVFPGETSSTATATTTPEAPRLSEEPRVRVGLYKPEGTVQFISEEDDYAVYKGSERAGILEKNKIGFLSLESGVYTFRGGGLEFSSGEFIRLVPSANVHAVFTLLNYDRPVAWKAAKRNFNTYRGGIELRQTKDGSAVYVINELRFEDYMSGIGENSNAAPYEYLKAQSVAQRTYAYYIKEQSDKHDSRNFDVVAHTGDQLYLGFESEKIMPRFVEAVSSTRGYMVTYKDDVVITPYFGVSSGRTKSWVEVWGGSEKPWLVSVPATFDKRDGVRKNGHGVGMAQRDASIRAEEESLDWVALLKYYYTGIEVHRIYP